MSLINVFRQKSAVRFSVEQCSKQLTRFKSTESKKDDLKEKIKMKTPIGNT